MALVDRLGGGILSRLRQRNCLISTSDKTVIVSATMDITDSYSIQVSTNQIENGSNITDHAHMSPETLSVNGILSNDDFDYTNPINLAYDTAEQAKELLIEFAKKAEKLEVRYKDNVYTDYLITSISFVKSQDVGNNYNVSLTFQKIYIATAATGQAIQKGKQPVQAKPIPKTIIKGLFG